MTSPSFASDQAADWPLRWFAEANSIPRVLDLEYRDFIREKLADTPSLPLDCVSVKFKTAEKVGRRGPDAPTRVLLAVIAKHPEAAEDVLRKAS